jgi:glutathione S-transferase
MKLYCSVTSPYARKVRAVALERRIELALELLTGPFTSLSPHNPLGKVPVLVRDDGTAVFDSPVIIECLDGLGHGPSLLGQGETRIAVGIWQALGDGIMDATVIRGMELRRPSEAQLPSTMQHQEGKIAHALEYAEARIGQGFLVDERFTVADIALCSALGYVDLRYAHAWRDAYPRLAGYVERVGARPSLVETRPTT